MKFVGPIAWAIVKCYGIPVFRVDDMVGDGQIALVEAANRYSKTKNGPFKPYAYKCIRGQMLLGLKKGRLKNTKPIIDRDAACQPKEINDEEELFKDQTEERWEQILDHLDKLSQSGQLTKLLADVLKARFKDRKGFAEIGKEMGIGRDRARQKVYEGLRRIKLIRSGYEFPKRKHQGRCVSRVAVVNKLRAAIPSDISIERFAFSVGLTPRHLQQVVRSESCPSLESALIIARELGKPVEELFQLDDRKEADHGNSNS